MQNAEAQGAPPVEICGTAGGNFTGSINETYTGGDCNISGPLTLSGGISITTTNGAISTTNMTANGGAINLQPSTYLAAGMLQSSANDFVVAGTTVNVNGAIASAGQVYLNGPSGVTVSGAVTASTYIDNRAANGNVSYSAALTSGSYMFLQGLNITSTSTMKAGTYIQATSSIQTLNIKGTITTGTTNSGVGGSLDLETSQTIVLQGAVTAGTTTGGTGASVTLKAPTSIMTAGITAYDFVYLESDSGTVQSSQAVVSTNNYINLIGENLKSTSTSNSYSAGYYINASDSNIQTIDLDGSVISGTPEKQQ
jgi:hypothetical protein